MTDFLLDRDPSPVVEFEDCAKEFDRTPALRGLTFSIPRGAVVGFVGRNGAGKSTAIRCLVGLQQPTRGTVRLFGEDPWTLEPSTKQRLGYLSETEIPFPWATTNELIRFCQPLYPNWDEALAAKIVERYRLDPKKKLPGTEEAS
ncbi:MAG: ATP-binding cassette domain-containing protein [Planctomycetota bacterium]